MDQYRGINLTTYQYAFTVKNNGSVPTYYYINLIKDGYSTLANDLVKYTLKKNGVDMTPSLLNIYNYYPIEI